VTSSPPCCISSSKYCNHALLSYPRPESSKFIYESNFARERVLEKEASPSNSPVLVLSLVALLLADLRLGEFENAGDIAGVTAKDIRLGDFSDPGDM
jgi:hypothetical protein